MKPKAKRQGKYNAHSTVIDGIRFPSKLEGGYYEYLKAAKSIGAVKYFLRQVPFDLPGGVTYRCDFQVFWKDGAVSFVDTKGKETETFKIKKKQVEALYPVTIDIVKRVPSLKGRL